jgi:hypothetical protein
MDEWLLNRIVPLTEANSNFQRVLNWDLRPVFQHGYVSSPFDPASLRFYLRYSIYLRYRLSVYHARFCGFQSDWSGLVNASSWCQRNYYCHSLSKTAILRVSQRLIRFCAEKRHRFDKWIWWGDESGAFQCHRNLDEQSSNAVFQNW